MSLTDMWGYLASLILVITWFQKDMWRLRIMSIAACVIWVVYGFMLGSIPVIITNSLIGIINMQAMYKLRHAQ